MKRGWYFHCPECGVLVFISRWKWWAKGIVKTYNRQARAGMFDQTFCAHEVELEYRD